MMTPGTRYRKLAIVVSPDGEFYHPTSPDEYGEGDAIADTILGKWCFTFQKLEIEKTRFLRRKIWQTTEKLEQFEGRGSIDGWKPLA